MRITYDLAMMFPMMEMSCGMVSKIEGMHYLYNNDTGMNDYWKNLSEQHAVAERLRKKEKYECDREFLEKARNNWNP